MRGDESKERSPCLPHLPHFGMFCGKEGRQAVSGAGRQGDSAWMGDTAPPPQS